jgi:hypothetical protein
MKGPLEHLSYNIHKTFGDQHIFQKLQIAFSTSSLPVKTPDQETLLTRWT